LLTLVNSNITQNSANKLIASAAFFLTWADGSSFTNLTRANLNKMRTNKPKVADLNVKLLMITVRNVLFRKNTLLLFVQVAQQITSKQNRIASNLVPRTFEIRHTAHYVKAHFVWKFVDLFFQIRSSDLKVRYHRNDQESNYQEFGQIVYELAIMERLLILQSRLKQIIYRIGFYQWPGLSQGIFARFLHLGILLVQMKNKTDEIRVYLFRIGITGRAFGKSGQFTE
jgi:hypothetical protein